MLAAFFNGTDTLELRQVPQPECPEGGLLIGVSACAVCGTDVKTLRQSDVKIEGGKLRQMELPRVLGHEFAGRVSQVGSDVGGFRVGDRVEVAPTVPCGHCSYCLDGYGEMCDRLKVFGYDWDGGFREFVEVGQEVLAAGCVIPIPDAVPDEHASISEPVSCALNCLDLSPVKKGDTVAIIGSGPLGVILSDLARWKGAERVVVAEASEEQIAVASAFSSADVFVNTKKEDLRERIGEITSGRGVDVLIIACSAPDAQAPALDLVAKRGMVNLFAGLPRGCSTVSWDTNLIHYKECMVTGTHGSRPRHLEAALELMASDVLDPAKYITHRFTLADINLAINTARGAGKLKVVVTP